MAITIHSKSQSAASDFTTVVRQEANRLSRAADGSVPQLRGEIGLALSGGGIRSATFSLGVLQALAARGKLSVFDYLSTVSGGGYIGSWLSAWVHREKDGISGVERALAKHGSGGGADPQASEPPAVVWLRKYSNYLAPRVGLLSIDSLTLMSIWMRNVLLNLLIVIAFLATVLLLPPLLVPLVPMALGLPWIQGVAYLLGLGVLPLAICINLAGVAFQDGHRIWLTETRGVLTTVLVPGTLAGIFGSLSTFAGEFGFQDFGRASLIALMALGVAAIAWLAMQLRGANRSVPWRVILKRTMVDGTDFVVATIVSIGTVLLLLLAERQFFSHSTAKTDYDYVKLLVFGPPAFLVTFGIGGFIFVGLAGRAYYERSREWWSRLNAWFFIVGTAWFLLMFTALYAPAIFKWIMAEQGGWARKLAGATWLTSLAATILGPRIKSISKDASHYLMNLLNVAAYVVIIGLVFGIATLARESLTAVEKRSQSDFQITACRHVAAAEFKQSLSGLKKFISDDIDDMSDSCAATIAGVPLSAVGFAAVLATLLLFGWRIDVNKFSLHNMYKNRLIRCYLGASRVRNPQPFTGFDEKDDLRLAEMSAQRPLHIVNTCLNISQGQNLAWQERKAASFVLTPLYCGFAFGKSQGDTTLKKGAVLGAEGEGLPDYASIAGFRPTDLYSGDDDLLGKGYTLGMAMAVSGAAASPNMGAMTKPALAFVMTLFNARLGRWTANPARNKWKLMSPTFGMICFLQELFGWSNEKRNFVYLSDGGHFENLGLYELIRRRCRCVWVVDATADAARSCEDLGRAVRQCRVDFGVDIELNLADLVALNGAVMPKAGFARGTIHYGNGLDGVLIYIKPTLCADCLEPDDLLAYAKREPTFPHQSTADQFFDESQFESYRRLGLHIGEKCLAAHESTLL
jgi:hypothetical protein